MRIRKDLGWVILLSLIVLLPNLILCCVGSDLKGDFLKTVGYLCFSVTIFLLPSFILKAKQFFLYQGLFVLLAPIEIAHLYQNKMPVKSGFMMLLWDTNWQESTELLSSFKPFIVYALIVIFIYFFVAITKITNSFLLPNKKARWIALSAFVAVFLSGFLYSCYLSFKVTPVKSEMLPVAIANYQSKFHKIYPCNLVVSAVNVWEIRQKIRQINENIANVSFDAQKRTPIDQQEVYVFVLGETARYNSFSINGYERKTSPMLEQIASLISFSDFYSEANVTQFALPLILSPVAPQTYNNYYREKTFVDAFKEAGFATYWIANQSASNNFIRRIAKDADGEFFSTMEFDAVNNYDEYLWTYFDKVLQTDTSKMFVFLHTLGSHFRYNFRYPESFKVFNPCFEGAFDYTRINKKNKEMLVNTYDNSILYTDYFLANTIRKLDSLKVASYLIYTSDHGENLYDDNRNMSLHANVIPTEYDVHVPFFVWTSEKYNELYPHKVQALESNKDKPASAAAIFYTTLDLADITFPRLDLAKSLASGTFQEDSIRYILKIDMTISTFP